MLAQERKDAVVLYESLKKAEEAVKQGERDPKAIVKAVSEMIRKKPSARIDYIAVVDTKNLRELKTISGEALVALAVFVGSTRLIDNIILTLNEVRGKGSH